MHMTPRSSRGRAERLCPGLFVRTVIAMNWWRWHADGRPAVMHRASIIGKVNRLQFINDQGLDYWCRQSIVLLSFCLIVAVPSTVSQRSIVTPPRMRHPGLPSDGWWCAFYLKHTRHLMLPLATKAKRFESRQARSSMARHKLIFVSLRVLLFSPFYHA
jgi:hypothetical protein